MMCCLGFNHLLDVHERLSRVFFYTCSFVSPDFISQYSLVCISVMLTLYLFIVIHIPALMFKYLS